MSADTNSVPASSNPSWSSIKERKLAALILERFGNVPEAAVAWAQMLDIYTALIEFDGDLAEIEEAFLKMVSLPEVEDLDQDTPIQVISGDGSGEVLSTHSLKDILDILDGISDRDKKGIRSMRHGGFLLLTLPNGNNIRLYKTFPKPKAGMGGTYRIGGDVYPCTVIHATDTQVTVRFDNTAHRNGTTYFLPDEEGERVTFTWRKKSRRWRKKGSKNGAVFSLGTRRYRMDPSF